MQAIPIGCDVSKGKIDLCVWLNDGKQEYLLIGNNQKGYLKALAEQDARLIACYCLKMQPKADYVKPNPEQYAVRRNIALLKQLNAEGRTN
mgnify:CR=1 FL=1